MGGLGNQMFQYAAGRRLAVARNTTLKLDTSLLGGASPACTARQYGLDVFNIHEDFASKEEIKLLGCGEEVSRSIFIRSIEKYALIRPVQAVFRERFFHFDPDVLCLPDNICMIGYWQSEKYFADIADMIREDFQVKPAPSSENRLLGLQITSCESVALHVRRGDFVSNPQTAAYHGSSDMNYYCRAARLIAEQINNPHFFLFSDDPSWFEEKFNLPYPCTLIGHNGAETAYEDLRLMSRCRYHIIANSTFSWWGAWLCSHPGKIIISPSRWFTNTSVNTADLIPPGWHRL